MEMMTFSLAGMDWTGRACVILSQMKKLQKILLQKKKIPSIQFNQFNKIRNESKRKSSDGTKAHSKRTEGYHYRPSNELFSRSRWK